ncbi:hypothetical protein CDD83_4403 [Cordyceps sp. RAO-2017]|nr:hypothetical protein CDD83_4403 [Cordyceps sp. RAO-2017]
MKSAYRNLSPRTRLGLGVGVLAWGLAGLYLSGRAEERFGLRPTDDDRDRLRRLEPSVVAVDRADGARR